MKREYTCKLAEECLLASRPASLQRTAVPSMDTPAETTQEPRISGACRTIRRRWSKILKAKDRMMTPRKLIRKSPAPYRPAPCSIWKACILFVALFLCCILFVALFLLHAFFLSRSSCCILFVACILLVAFLDKHLLEAEHALVKFASHVG